MSQVERRLSVMRTVNPVTPQEAEPVRFVAHEWGMEYKAVPVVEGDYNGPRHLEVSYGTIDQFRSLMEVVGASKRQPSSVPFSVQGDSNN